MNELIFDLDLQSNRESNLFLRALWAEFRGIYGEFGWQFSPYRDGKEQRISFGQSNLGELGVYYKKRGCIDQIYFRPDKDTSVISSAVEIAKSKFRSPISKFLRSTCLSLYPLNSYKSHALRINGAKRNRSNLTLRASGFDSVDRAAEYQVLKQQCMDLIAVETNLPVWGEQELYREKKMPPNAIFGQDLDWIDGVRLSDDKRMLLSRQGLDFLDYILDDSEKGQGFHYFLKACNLFNMARIYDAQENDSEVMTPVSEKARGNTVSFKLKKTTREPRLAHARAVGAGQSEISSVLYVSALESLASIDKAAPTTCNACNQKIYAISKGVTDLADKHGGPAIQHFVKEFYSVRSKFLHEGSLRARSNYSGVSIPLLDPSSSTGCVAQLSRSDVNLREFTSFLIRKFLYNERARLH